MNLQDIQGAPDYGGPGPIRFDKLTRAEVDDLPPEDIQVLIHELQVHQVELSMQNEELRGTQLELGEVKDRYQDLYDFAPIGYLTLDQDGRIQEANLVASVQLGVERQLLMGQALQRFVADEDQAAFQRYLSTVQDETVRQRCELRLIQAGGTRTVRLESVADEGSDGEHWRCFTAMIDLTERCEAERALREGQDQLSQANQLLQQTNARKDEFLAMLAHELRNPLAAIDSAVRLSCRTISDSARDEAHKIAQRQLRHLSRLIDDLLDVSRITRGIIELRRQDLDIADVISNAVETERAPIEDRGQELVVRSPGERLFVNGDMTRLEQILVNILSNATKYTPPGGRIEISSARSGDQVLVRVKDTGIGIERDRLAQVFDLFTQLQPTLDRTQGGLGIGLTIVQGLLHLHGGTAVAESAGHGKGSTISIALPAIESALEQPKRELGQNGKPGCGGDGHRVLVVEDNPDTAFGLQMLLELSGYEVRLAHEGRHAVEIAREFVPHFVVLDIGLPGLNGYEVAKRIRGDETARSATVVGLSGYGQKEDRERSREAGFNYHLVKPVDYEELVSLLARCSAETAAAA